MDALTLDQALRLPDDDLDEAVFHHALHRVSEAALIGATRAQMVAVLPKGLRIVYSTWLVETQVSNGGFNQYFWNTSGELAQEALEGYIDFGAEEIARIVANAAGIYDRERPRQKRFKAARTLEAFAESYEHTDLNALDDAFYSAEKAERLTALRAAHIRSRPAEYELDRLESCFADQLNCSLRAR